ncbi:hypothetical protein [Krasilnikovia sp. MM14-A1259]|uniref:hypothetical protein n=1 Tax=Krasilnikovia sp. MM14-A1259 TaxID=3373539 RepID=UPI0038012F4D
MREKERQRLTAAVEPLLEPGERVMLVGQAMVSTVSVKTQVALAVATAVLSGGMMAATVQPSLRVVILTNQRLLVVSPGIRKVRIGGSLPRGLLTVTRLKKRLTKVQFDLAIDGQRQALRLAFIFTRRDGMQFAEAISDSETTRA